MTDDHLVIVMEYASNGQLFERIDTSGRLDEEVARKLYQQLIDGMEYSHKQVGLSKILRHASSAGYLRLHAHFVCLLLHMPGAGWSSHTASGLPPQPMQSGKTVCPTFSIMSAHQAL